MGTARARSGPTPHALPGVGKMRLQVPASPNSWVDTAGRPLAGGTWGWNYPTSMIREVFAPSTPTAQVFAYRLADL